MALAVDGEFGVFEGRTFALIHPIVMASLFLYTLWAGYLGWQWRRVRTIQNEINELKKQLKPTPVTAEGTPVEVPPSQIELKIQQLTEVYIYPCLCFHCYLSTFISFHNCNSRETWYLVFSIFYKLLCLWDSSVFITECYGIGAYISRHLPELILVLKMSCKY